MTHKKLNQARDKNQFEIKLNITPEMTPSTKLIIYYIHKSGEIIYDSVPLGYERELKKHVSKGLTSRSINNREKTSRL